MFFALPVLIYGLLFFLGLELAAYKENWIIFLVIILSIFSLWTAKKLGGRWIFAIIPFIFSISALALLFLIDSIVQKQAFVILSILIYYLGLLGIFRLGDYEKDQTARGMVAAMATAAVFFSYSTAYGFYLNFLIPLWALMIFFLIVTVFISYQYFRLLSKDKKIVLGYSLILGMTMAEAAWMINFWPFGYLTTGVVVFMLYYVLWDLVQSYFLNSLSQKRVMANVVFFGILIGLVLFTTQWLPTV
ncbi:MAG: hypothetical protein NT136_03280 [Candidatus Moranbacteria bacterium]|nr:hypothetical protein [Candidatus Moranbacteria bacterium]